MNNFTEHIAGMYNRYTRLLCAIFIAVLTASSLAMSIPALDLLSNKNFVILAGSAITGIPPVNITGNVGLSPAAGSYITGFDGSNVTGYLYVVDASGPVGSVIDASLLQTAKSDLTTAYNDAAGRTPVPTGDFLNPNGGNIGGLNLVAGLYKFTSDAAITGSDVTLTGSNTDVWIFQIATSLNVGSGIKVILAGGAQAANIFWQVGSSATLGTYCVFKGTILADQSVSLGTGASMDGRALAFGGAVTMASDVTSTRSDLKFPIFSVDSSQVSFGNVTDGLTKKDSVVVKNTGNADLIISTVTSSNSLFTITPTNATIAPGATKKYYITYAPLVDGAKSGYIYFNHNAVNSKDSVKVTGTGVSPKFSVNPVSLNFGNVTNGTTKKDSVTVTNIGTANLIISTITSSNSLYTVTPTNGTITPGSSQKVYVTFAPLTNGIKTGFVYFNHNAANAKDSISVTGTGVTAAAPIFSVNPASLNFGNVTNGTTKKDSVTVTNIGTANLIISTITSSNSLYSVTPTNGTITPGSSEKIYVTFAPLTNGVKTGYVYFNHNAANAKDSINVTGIGVTPATPIFTVNPASLNFGNVINGTTKKDSVTVTNTGNANLIISTIISSNSLYTVTPTNGTITPGSTKKIYVTFSPLTNGVKTGYVYFNHNAANAKDSISVTGTGVTPAAPIFSVNPASLNFGNVVDGTTKKDSVTVTNTGNANLIISNITSSNSLFTVTPTNSTITPGSTQKIYVTFAPLTDGIKSGYVYFNHNASNAKDSISLTGTGVSPKFSAFPMSVDFGDVRTDLSKTEYATVTNTGTSDLIISNIVISNSVFTITPPYGTITPGSTIKFDITFSPKVDGLQTGYIYFYHNAGIGKDSISLSGTGISPKFTVNPLNLNFGNVRNDLSKKDSVTVTNTGTADLIISSVTSSNSLFTVTPTFYTIIPGSSAKFFVTFSPIADGLQSGYIYFNHNAKNPKDSISVTGTGVSPKFSVNPLSLNFGNVRNETSKKDSVTVTNTGTIDLIISSVTSSNSLFTVTPTIGTLTPGSSAKFYITFSPLVDGLQTGNIYFNHNAKIPQDIVAVSGTGVSPKFAVSPTSLNFGNVRNETSKKDSVTVTNTGTADLIISSVSSSNSLFTFTPSASTLTPGSSSKFYITFSPLVDGLQTGNIYFNHNAKIPQDIVTVSGTGVSPKFSVTPLNINFGNVRNETSKKDSVTVTNTGTADLIIGSITSSNSLFTITPTIGTITPGSSAKFYITFSPLVDGLQTGNIYFNHNAKIPQDIVTVSGTGVSPKFSVTPLNINFGKVRNETSKMDSVTVTNTGTADLIISSVVSSNSLFTVTPTYYTLLPGSSAKFYITFSPLVDGMQAGNIYFNHNAKIPQDIVTVSGTGVSPKFSVYPNSLDFGNVRNDLTKTQTLTVTNTGTADLIISSVSSSNVFFTITPANVLLQPGATQIFNVTFAPIADGLQKGYIYFNHNAKIPKDSVSVSGTGVSPKFSVTPLFLDFGDVRNEFDRKTLPVVVTNTGTADLIISDITSSNAFYATNPTNGVITPGSSQTFDITFSPMFDGIQNGFIYFHHNAKNLIDSVRVTGNGVSPGFQVDNRDLHFENTVVGTRRIDSIIVTNTGSLDLIISKITTTRPMFFSVYPTNITIAPGKSYKFYVTFSPQRDGYESGEGNKSGYIYFWHNAVKAFTFISVRGTGVVPKFSADPKSLNFGNVNIGIHKSDSITVTNIGKADLTIYGATSSNPLFSVTTANMVLGPGASRNFYVTFSPLANGLENGYIYFNHNALNALDSVSVSGTTGIAPMFTVSTSNLDFGSLMIGRTKQKSVIVKNTGTIDLKISSIISSDTHYSIASANTTIIPGASMEFFITFAPTEVGQIDATIQFNHNAGRDIINVTGIGIVVVSIKDARELPIGTEFAVEGIATRTLGSYTRIQDPTGGLTIVQDSGAFYNDVQSQAIKMGDMIHVQGIVSEVGFLKVIKDNDLTEYQRLSRGNILPTPIKVTLAELAKNGEQYESCLITLENLTIAGVKDVNFNAATTYLTTDISDITNAVSIRIGNSEDTYTDGMPFKGTSMTFEGVLSQSSQTDPAKGYQLTPVLTTDLRQVVSGVTETTGFNRNSLSDNYPNPFSNSTTIQYSIEKADFVTLKVMNVLGVEITTLVNEYQIPGTYYIPFSTTGISVPLSDGIYFYRLKVGTFVTSKQMILLK